MATPQALFESLEQLGAFKLGNVESRLSPLRQPFIHMAAPTGLRRRHSFCGVPSWHQQEMFGQSCTSDSDMQPPCATSEPPSFKAKFQEQKKMGKGLSLHNVKDQPEARMNQMVKDLVEDLSPGGFSQGSTCADSPTSMLGTKMCDSPKTMMVPSEEITTMTVRNMQTRLKQTDFVQELDESGFAGTYDWCYMPSNIAANPKTNGGGQGKGYGFVNFTKPEFAKRFKTEWHRTRRYRMSRTNVLDVSVASCQGRTMNNEMFMRGKTSRIMSANFRPHEPEFAVGFF